MPQEPRASVVALLSLEPPRPLPASLSSEWPLSCLLAPVTRQSLLCLDHNLLSSLRFLCLGHPSLILPTASTAIPVYNRTLCSQIKTRTSCLTGNSSPNIKAGPYQRLLCALHLDLCRLSSFAVHKSDSSITILPRLWPTSLDHPFLSRLTLSRRRRSRSHSKSRWIVWAQRVSRTVIQRRFR